MRPPMLAGPMPRQTNRFNIGSLDQLIGVGVGLGLGVGMALGVGDGFCKVAADGFSACAAKAPSAMVTEISRPKAAARPPSSRTERRVSFIGETSFQLIVIKKNRSRQTAFAEKR